MADDTETCNQQQQQQPFCPPCQSVVNYNSSEPITGFEGCEKKLELDFILSSPEKHLRHIPRSTIDEFLTDARCTIISHTPNAFFDAYVLSESSLFVYPSKIVIKTCGTTRLLQALPKILKAAAELEASVDFVQFSRCNFIFPHAQPFPHRNFTMEVQYLNTFFKNGHAHILGPINGPRWHLYTADQQKLPSGQDQTLEIVMFNLDPKVMRQFYKRMPKSRDLPAIDLDAEALGLPLDELKTDSKGTPSEAVSSSASEAGEEEDEHLPETGAEATRISGIDKLVPGAVIDDFLFTPCGYSCNGLKDDAYFTIHITPEPHCSFVSFETNLKLPSYTDLVRRVVETFKPGNFCVSLFKDSNAAAGAAAQAESSGWQFAGYVRKGHTVHSFEADYDVSCGHFVSHELANLTADQMTLRQQQQYAAHLDEDASGAVHLSVDVARKLEEHHMVGVAVAAVKQRFLVQTVESSIVDLPGKLISSIVEQEQPDEPFFLCDIGEMVRRYRRWITAFPRMEPMYNVKCNSSPGILLALAALGCNFVCTNLNDIKAVLNVAVPSERIFFANPWKPDAHVRFASDKNLGLLSFDTVPELRKIVRLFPRARLMLRFSGSTLPRNNSMPDLLNRGTGRKHRRQQQNQHHNKAALLAMMQQQQSGGATMRRQGALPNQVPELLAEAKRLGAQVVGVNISYGTACEDVDDFKRIVRDARNVFDQAKRILGYDLSVLDVGAVIPPELDDDESESDSESEPENERRLSERSAGEDTSSSDEEETTLEQAERRRQRKVVLQLPNVLDREIARAFPGVRVIGRLSRFLVSRSNCLVVNVVSRRPMVKSNIRSSVSVIREEAGDLSDDTSYSDSSPVESLPQNGGHSTTDDDGDDSGSLSDDAKEKQEQQQQRAVRLQAPPKETKDPKAAEPAGFQYSINDGCYGSFANVMSSGRIVHPHVARLDLDEHHGKQLPLFPSYIYGPTGDSLDCVARKVMLPKLDIGEWLYFRSMGAFVSGASAHALGFEPPEVRYINTWTPL